MITLLFAIVCIETLPTIENGTVNFLSNASNNDGTVEIAYQCDDGSTHENKSTLNICRDSGGFYAWKKSAFNVTQLCQPIGKFNSFFSRCVFPQKMYTKVQ